MRRILLANRYVLILNHLFLLLLNRLIDLFTMHFINQILVTKQNHIQFYERYRQLQIK